MIHAEELRDQEIIARALHKIIMMSSLFQFPQLMTVVLVFLSVWSVKTLRTALFARAMLYKITLEQAISAHVQAYTTTLISPTSTIAKVSYLQCL